MCSGAVALTTYPSPSLFVLRLAYTVLTGLSYLGLSSTLSGMEFKARLEERSWTWPFRVSLEVTGLIYPIIFPNPLVSRLEGWQRFSYTGSSNSSLIFSGQTS